MAFEEDINFAKNLKNRSYSPGFFYLISTSSVSSLNERYLNLQQMIQKKEQYIAEVEHYISHAKEPIEQDIKDNKVYKKQRAKPILRQITAKIMELEAKIRYKLCPLSDLPPQGPEENTIYINSESREGVILGQNKKTAYSFSLKKETVDLKDLNVLGLKSEILGFILQEGIVKNFSLAKETMCIKTLCVQRQEIESKYQQAQDSIIELNQRLGVVSKKIDDFKKALPQEIQALKQLQAELINTEAELLARKIEPHFMSLSLGAA